MSAEGTAPHLTLNVVHDVSEVLEYHFMVNALLAGGVVAVTAAVVGWLMVVRRESFAGHTLSMMAFPGASGAVLLGVPAAWGYFTFCGTAALMIARLTRTRRGSWAEQSAGIGAVQAAALAAGFLFVSLYGGVLGDLESLLFGNLLAVSDSQVVVLAGVGAGTLALLGVAVAATSQITGPLLVFALLVGPAATAQALTARPLASLALSVAIGLLVVWVGLGVAYFSPYPAGFFIATISFSAYVLARLGVALRAKLARRPDRAGHASAAGHGAVA